MLTAGFRWAPEIFPMNRMIPITISAGRNDRGLPADHVRERVAHHPATGGDEHQEERPEQLREQTSPLLARIVEVGDSIHDPLLVASDRTKNGGFAGWCCGHLPTPHQDQDECKAPVTDSATDGASR